MTAKYIDCEHGSLRLGYKMQQEKQQLVNATNILCYSATDVSATDPLEPQTLDWTWTSSFSVTPDSGLYWTWLPGPLGQDWTWLLCSLDSGLDTGCSSWSCA